MINPYFGALELRSGDVTNKLTIGLRKSERKEKSKRDGLESLSLQVFNKSPY